MSCESMAGERASAECDSRVRVYEFQACYMDGERASVEWDSMRRVCEFSFWSCVADREISWMGRGRVYSELPGRLYSARRLWNTLKFMNRRGGNAGLKRVPFLYQY